MILNFSVQNFGPIKEKQVLSFEAEKTDKLEDIYVVKIGKHRVLKLALIFGANASGKTTILDALDFLQYIVFRPEVNKYAELSFYPFLFDSKTPKETSEITLEFFQNDIKYLYEVEFTQKAIISEVLYSFNPRKSVVYKRSTDLSKQFTEITFGGKINVDSVFVKTLEANTLWNNTVLGGYQKTNINNKELQEVVNWFSKYLKPVVYSRTELEKFVTAKIKNNEISKKDIITILKRADLNISDIVINEKEMEVTEDFIEFLKKQGLAHGDRIKEIEEKGSLKTENLEFTHTVENVNYNLPIELESEGTRRYYGFAGLLALLINTPTAIPIDELESSLHPDLYEHFLLMFLLNSNKSQLIATTHNREILDNRDLFRDDAIWFTDKQENCTTELYSLADFDSSVIRNTTNVLNAYKSGKLSGTPNFGDVFLDLGL